MGTENIGRFKTIHQERFNSIQKHERHTRGRQTRHCHWLLWTRHNLSGRLHQFGKVSSQYHRLICSFIRWYGRPMDLPRVIFTLCRFTNGAQRNELKDIHNFYHKWKIRRCSISAHKSTYFFHKKHLFSFTHTYVWFPLIDTSFTYQVLSCTTS